LEERTGLPKRSLIKAAIEFKYAAKEDEVARAIGGIFEDVSGYTGSRDWNRFYQEKEIESKTRHCQEK
jgi:hypothetical protein